MSQILTIDWDYFFLSSLETRDDVFPKVLNGELNFVPDNSEWLNISDYSDVEVDFDSLDAFLSIIKYEKLPRIKELFISENHGEMYNIVNYIKRTLRDEESLTITNVDFHHDYYYTNGNNPCCDNWLRLVKEDYPDTILKWCKKSDSVTTSFGEDVIKSVPIQETLFGIVLRNLERGVYDYIHICRSDLYSPPLADEIFDRTINALTKFSANIIGQKIVPDRTDVYKKFMDKYIEEQMKNEKFNK